jgi:hypothetical protein
MGRYDGYDRYDRYDGYDRSNVARWLFARVFFWYVLLN